ncbi:unnamed protein product [Symbiodinium sp. CCMP2592]|nr:unnamed protein product [Symbiodinium sp. CCMP2592]
MPQFGLIGDSSLYCKNSSRRVKRIGAQLQEQLATNDLWYHAVPNAGVGKILQMLTDTPLKFGTLGISYFGNDIMYGKIGRQVRAAWEELMDIVEDKADRIVFVVGGSSKKYAKHWNLTSHYDENLAQVRTWLHRRNFLVRDFREELRRWKLSGDGLHWDSEVAEELCATWTDLLSPTRCLAWPLYDQGSKRQQPWESTASRSAGVARDHNGSAWNSRRGRCDYDEPGSSYGYWPDDGKRHWRDGDSYEGSCKRRKVDDAGNGHQQPWEWTASRSAGVARDHNGSAWNSRRGRCDYDEPGSSYGYWPDDGKRHWRDGDSYEGGCDYHETGSSNSYWPVHGSRYWRDGDDARAYSTASAKPW